MKLSFAIAALVAGLGLPSQAFAARIFVSSKGADAAGCGATTRPCRTFQYAHNIAPAYSEIDVMDGGEYGTVAISKPISIVNDGAGVATIKISNRGYAGVYVGAGASDAVYLRGLTIDGERFGGSGVYFASGRSLTIRDSTFRQMIWDGVTVSASANALIDINNVTVTDNGTAGIRLTGTGSIVASIFDTRASRNTHGVFVQPTGPAARVVATISGGEASNNRETGYLFTAAGSQASIGAMGTLKGVTASNNTYGGVAAWEKTRVWISGATIANNGIGVDNVRATVTSYRNNGFSNNGAGDGVFVATSLK